MDQPAEEQARVRVELGGFLRAQQPSSCVGTMIMVRRNCDVMSSPEAVRRLGMFHMNALCLITAILQRSRCFPPNASSRVCDVCVIGGQNGRVLCGWIRSSDRRLVLLAGAQQ